MIQHGIPHDYPVPVVVKDATPQPTLRERVERLQAEMSKLPQVALETEHYFANGMYARKLFRPAGTLIVGKVHRHEHFYMLMYGRIQVTTDEGLRELGPGDVTVSKPGTKRAVLALEDSCAITVHRTDNTDLDAIEAEIIEPDDTALFDARNRLKEGLLP